MRPAITTRLPPSNGHDHPISVSIYDDETCLIVQDAIAPAHRPVIQITPDRIPDLISALDDAHRECMRPLYREPSTQGEA